MNIETPTTQTILALTISILSLVISGLTFWLTRVRKGKLKMTRPSIICFAGRNGGDEPKVFMRTLLFATSELGQHVQDMFVKLHRAETTQNFNIWAYGESGIVRGSGLFVNKAGVATYHHFLLPKNEDWKFLAGDYKLEIFAETINGKVIKLFEHQLEVTKEPGVELQNERTSLIFNWAPNSQNYVSHTDTRPWTTEELQQLLM